MRGVKRRAWAANALAVCAVAVAAAAQETARVPRDLIMSSTLERFTAAPDGSAAPDAEPGTAGSQADQVIVSVRFTNATAEIIDSIRITSPVPAGHTYVPESASGPGSEVLFSADNGLRFGRPSELTAILPDGNVRRADPADYTHVRWVLRAPLDAGATGIARYRAVPR